MPLTYLLAFLKVGDVPQFASGYASKVPATLTEFGGKYVAKVLPLKEKAAFVEKGLADDMTLCAVLSFPDKEKALAWKNSPAYQEIVGVRHANSTGPVIIAEGLGNEDKFANGVGAILCAFVKVNDMETFKQYAGKIPATLAPVGGQYLVKALPITNSVVCEGKTADDYTLGVLLGFESVEKAMKWHDSKLYLEDALPLRMKSSTGCVMIAGTI